MSTAPPNAPLERFSAGAIKARGGVVGNGDEERWMEAYTGGDRLAFTRLFRVLAPRVHAFYLRSFREPAVADELLQTTFLRVHRARATYRIGAPVAPWIFTIAANVRRDELRRRLRRKEDLDEEALSLAMAAEGAESIIASQENAEIADRVRAAVDALPEGQRVVIQLHRFEGFPLPEVARILGLKEVAVRVRASRAYDRLRVELAALRGSSPS